jgi:hypothetical protein
VYTTADENFIDLQGLIAEWKNRLGMFKNIYRPILIKTMKEIDHPRWKLTQCSEDKSWNIQS